MPATDVHHTAVVDTTWDGPAEVAKVADGDDAALLYMHAWYDDEAPDPNGDGLPDAKSDYKLPHHEAGTDTPAVVAAVRNALARLSSTDIPPDEVSGVEEHLRAHLDDFNAGRMRPVRHGARESRRIFPLEDIRIQPASKGGDGRTVEAYAAVFDRPVQIEDWEGQYEEVIRAGSFAKTIAENRTNFQVLFNHGMDIYGVPYGAYSMPIGKPLDVREDAKGVYTLTRYASSPLADQLLELINMGAITGQSFSGRFLQSRQQTAADGTILKIERLEVQMREYGPAVFPAYRDAAIVGVRAADIAAQCGHLTPEQRAAIARILAAGTPLEAALGTLEQEPLSSRDTRHPAAGEAPGYGPSLALLAQEQRRRRSS